MPAPHHGEPLTADYHIIKNAMPDWLIKASPTTREALRATPAMQLDWLDSLTAEQRRQLLQYTERSAVAQHAVDQAMAGLQSAEAFARPLLLAALKGLTALEPDLDATFVELRNPIELGVLGVRVGSFSVLTLSLLQAALHNFEAGECSAGAFDLSSRFKSGPAPGDATVALGVSIENFLSLCRTLDIGAQYQAHIARFFQGATGLREQVIQAQKAALQAAAYLALLKSDISANDYAVLLAVIAGQQNIEDDGKPVWFHDVSIMGLRLSGCTVFAAVEKYQPAGEVLVYIPHDPQHPLKKYASCEDFEAELTRQLMADVSVVSGPGRYQQFLVNYIAYADQPTYWRRLTQSASNQPRDPLIALRIGRYVLPFVSPLASLAVGPRQLPPAKSAREPIQDPDFYIRVISKREMWQDNVDLWRDNFDKLQAKFTADARSHAVSTADVDARVRAEKIATLEEVGLLALNLVSMFVPGLGEVMMGVMVAQLLYETFEGVVEWHEGDREMALGHLTDVAENLAFIGATAAAGVGLRKVLSPPPVIEGLRPVTLADGRQKLLKTDLASYKLDVRLPAEAKPDALGLYAHEGQTVLPLEGDHFAVRYDELDGQYRIQHPTRPQAYAPALSHNHEGAWQHEAQNPLSWDEPTLLRRLGLPAKGLSAEQLQQAGLASGVEADTLRAGHIDQLPVPLILADTLQRFRAADDLATFIRQLRSQEPAVYAQADPGLQMDLLLRQGLLPETPLRVFDDAGAELWHHPAATPVTARSVVLTEGGELLQDVMYVLQGEDPALREFPGKPDESLTVRARQLRAFLAQKAEACSADLLQARDRAQNLSRDPDASLLMSQYPGVSRSMAEHLVNSLSGEQRTLFRAGSRLPEQMEQQARWLQQEVRVSRAYEGLFVESLSNPDSHRLALHTLESLPGWPRGMRVELRAHSATGALMDAIGDTGATERKILIMDESGQFNGPAPGDLYSALWAQLSTGQRQALDVGEAAQLQSLIRRTPLPREPMRAVLLANPVRKPVYDPSMRLLGGGRGIPQWVNTAANTFRTPEHRIRRLFPRFDDAAVASFIEGLGTDVRGEISRLEAQYATLKQELKTWVRANAPLETATAFDHQGGFVKAWADEIKRCWRRESTSLTIKPLARLGLPPLSVDFSHVENLELTHTLWSADANIFLSRFSQLKQLRIRDVALETLPEAIASMDGLTLLMLRNTRMQLTASGVEQLARISRMEHLVLAYNPLGLAPDVSGMAQLKYLDLSHTQLEHWPVGLRDQKGLLEVNLRDNALREVPTEHLNPLPEHAENVLRLNTMTSLAGNLFTPQAEQALDDYWRRLSQTHPEMMADGRGDRFSVMSHPLAQVRNMHPNFDVGQCRQFIWNLGEGAEAEVNRLSVEFSTLKDQLDAWVFTGGGARQRYVSMRHVLENVTGRDHRSIAKTRILACWRRETPQRLSNEGIAFGLELDLSDLTLPALPDLDADFSHVGSLRLTRMNLSASPEGFLSGFRGLRWLDMSNNQLRELPPAVGEMDGLTRLFLVNNQIQLTPETARVLSGRTTLRALWMDGNPLGEVPDFIRIPDMRSVRLKGTDIDRWPAGLGDQPMLDSIDLSNNQLTTLPEHIINPTADQLPHSVRLCSITSVSNNPFTPATLEQVRQYSARLVSEQLQPTGQALRLPSTALGLRSPIAVRTLGAPFERWTSGLTPEQVAPRTTQWARLHNQPASAGFFQVLADMQAPVGGHEDLQRRVWEVIDSITEPNAESAALREEMFTWAGRAACCDRAALSFSNLEIMRMVYRAKGSATEAGQGPALLKLARGLFRLDEVEKTALNDIADRSNAIHANPQLSAEGRRTAISLLEEVEIRLAYRYGLKGADQLALPGQPDQARFISLGRVSQADLDAARIRILALDNSPEEFQALLSRDFWKDYITHTYRPQFEAQSKPYHEQLAGLLDRVESGQLLRADYDNQARALQDQLSIDEAGLIESLTRTELRLHPMA